MKRSHRPTGTTLARTGQRRGAHYGAERCRYGCRRDVLACVSACRELHRSGRNRGQERQMPRGRKWATGRCLWQRSAACCITLHKAEGTGLEPATGKPAPDFESGCSPIRIPSEVVVIATDRSRATERLAPVGRLYPKCTGFAQLAQRSSPTWTACVPTRGNAIPDTQTIAAVRRRCKIGPVRVAADPLWPTVRSGPPAVGRAVCAASGACAAKRLPLAPADAPRARCADSFGCMSCAPKGKILAHTRPAGPIPLTGE